MNTFATWNPADRSAKVALSADNLRATGNGLNDGFKAVRSNMFKNSGKWYCELLYSPPSLNFNGFHPRVGISTVAYGVDTPLGVGGTEYCYRYDGKKMNNNVATAYDAVGYGTPPHVLSVVFDAGAGTLSFWKDGVDQGVAYTAAPGSYAATVETDGGDAFVANFGATTFAYAPPSGYAGWSVAAAAAPALYDQLAATVVALLEKYGQVVTLKSNPVGSYNPATGATSNAPGSAARKAALFDFGEGVTSFRGTLIEQTDKKCLMEVGVVPTERDTVVVGAFEYTIISVGEINPAGTPVVYSLHLRR